MKEKVTLGEKDQVLLNTISIILLVMDILKQRKLERNKNNFGSRMEMETCHRKQRAK